MKDEHELLCVSCRQQETQCIKHSYSTYDGSSHQILYFHVTFNPEQTVSKLDDQSTQSKILIVNPEIQSTDLKNKGLIFVIGNMNSIKIKQRASYVPF